MSKKVSQYIDISADASDQESSGDEGQLTEYDDEFLDDEPVSETELDHLYELEQQRRREEDDDFRRLRELVAQRKREHESYSTGTATATGTPKKTAPSRNAKAPDAPRRLSSTNRRITVSDVIASDSQPEHGEHPYDHAGDCDAADLDADSNTRAANEYQREQLIEHDRAAKRRRGLDMPGNSNSNEPSRPSLSRSPAIARSMAKQAMAEPKSKTGTPARKRSTGQSTLIPMDDSEADTDVSVVSFPPPLRVCARNVAEPLAVWVDATGRKLPKPYTLRRRNFGFTVFTSFPIEEILQWIVGTFNTLVYCTIGEEAAPTTGNRHVHVYIELSRQPNYKVCPFREYFHDYVHYSTVYDKEGWIDYCQKENNFVEHGCTKEEKKSMQLIINTALEAANSEREFIELINTHNSAYCLTNLGRMKEYYKQFKDRIPIHQTVFTEFKDPPHAIKVWLDNELKKADRPKCLVLHGPTRTGKTQLIRHLLPHAIYMRGNFNVNKILEPHPACNAIIFDDIEWEKIAHNAKALLTCMGEVELTDKYKPKITINMKWPAIYIMNDKSFDLWKTDPEFEAYWKENCVFLHITGKLY